MPLLPAGHARTSGPRRSRTALIASLAARQRGVVTRRQLLAAGLGPRGVERRLVDGDLHHFDGGLAGAYLVGHAVAVPWARETAALLLCGSDELHGRTAALSGASALFVHGLGPAPPVVEVTVPGRVAPRRRGVRGHATLTYTPADVTRVHGLPVTTPARTLLEMAPRVPGRELERALDRARLQRLVTDPELDAVLARAPGLRGARVLGALLEAERGGGLSRSGAEREVVRLVRKARLPVPRQNVMVLGAERDLVWVEQRLVVEIDGWVWHWTPRRSAADDRRDAELRLSGWETLRIAARTVRDEPLVVTAQLAAALAARRSGSPGAGGP